MSEWDEKKEDMGHPDSSIRLASAVYRFAVPEMNVARKLSFARSFRSCGKNEKTRKAMNKADELRKKLSEAVGANKVSHERVVADARRYLPYVHQILVSCKFQPEMARLDERIDLNSTESIGLTQKMTERLVFEWKSGVETSKKLYKAEAIMYEMVMCMVCEGLGKAGVATETSLAGEFAAASREYAAAAGIFAYLAEESLPAWVARGSKTSEADLPIECTVATAKGLSMLFKANAQQMAISTVLIKAGTPNYGLLAKLCLGVSEQLEAFTTHMNTKGSKQLDRLEANAMSITSFQVELQKALSMYFHARSLWENEKEYGLAIAILSDASLHLQAGGPKGMPDVAKIPALTVVQKDLTDLRGHVLKLLRTWESDNSHVYFEPVPQVVPVDKKLVAGIQLNKEEQYTVQQDVAPLLLSLSEEAMKRSDSDLAKELQDKLNAGEDI
eukprot:Nitzschia sp. Nitz4//scaffold2_size372955//27627//28986//NITZ4_000359-RA/size372955-snap-gene-0.61-mRNA-1//-1//CDS//3329546584//7272//frame0